MLLDVVILIFSVQNLGDRTIAVTTCQLWNSLSLELRNLVSLESFKNNYRNILFKEQQELHLQISQFDHILVYVSLALSLACKLIYLHCFMLNL